jgi:tetratricopeptide (TPR) repeat protein
LKYHKASILYELAVFNQDISLIDESKIYLDNCIKEDPEIIPARLLRAKIFLFEKKTEESMKLANQVLKIDKRIAEAYFIKGMIYHFLGNSNLASSSYQTAIEVDPNYFDAYIHMGMLSESEGNDIAVDYYNSAIEINSSSIEAHRNKGLYYHFNENYSEARKAFKFIVQIDSNFEETYFNIGNTFLGEYNISKNNSILDSALMYYQKATSLNSFYVQAIHNTGICYEIKNDLVKAKSCYSKAIEIDNNYIPSLKALNSLD